MSHAKAKSNGEAATPATNEVGGNKMEAVRRALSALGRDAKPTNLHNHILSAFQLDIKPNMISSYKSTILKSDGVLPKKRGRKPKSNGTVDTTVGFSIRDLLSPA
jgi:hypothetical protein